MTVRLNRCLLLVTLGATAVALAQASPMLPTLATSLAAQGSGTKAFIAEGSSRVGDVQGAVGNAVRAAVELAVVEILGNERVQGVRDALDTQILNEPRRFIVGDPKLVGTPTVEEGQVRVKVSATVAVAKLRVAVAALGSGTGPPLPRVLVIIYEEIIRLPPPPDPAAETVVNRGLLEAGYTVLSVKGVDERKQRDMVRALRKGDDDLVEALRREYDCEILVYGEAFAEETTRTRDMNRFEARVEAEAYYPDTAQKRCSLSATGIGLRPGPLISAKAALEQAGERVSKKLVDCLSAPTTPSLLHLRVTALASLVWADKIEEYVRALDGIEQVARRSVDVEGRTGSWDLTGPGAEAPAVASALRGCPEPRLKIVEQTAAAITAEVVD